MKFFSLDAGQNRIFGLDLLRFFAIFFVILGHSVILLPPQYKQIVKSLVLDGVSIFFVLSGFLIGQILFKQINRGETKLKHLLDFWKRRWLRTIPAYFFVLTIVILLTNHLKANRLPDEWFHYYLFIQNFGFTLPRFFQESWSLSVEEWFYLLTPTVLFIGIFFFKKRQQAFILTVILASIFGIIFYRWYLFEDFHYLVKYDSESTMLQQVVPRLDGIMLGVLGAFLAVYHAEFWTKLNQLKWVLFLLLVISLFVLKSFYTGNDSFFYCVAVPSLKGFGALVMLPFLSNWKTQKSNLLTKSITFVSVTSYSMYLINRTFVIDFVIKYGLHDNLRKNHVTDKNWIFEYLLFWILTFVLSFLMYKLIEKPFLALRDWKKSN